MRLAVSSVGDLSAVLLQEGWEEWETDAVQDAILDQLVCAQVRAALPQMHPGPFSPTFTPALLPFRHDFSVSQAGRDADGQRQVLIQLITLPVAWVGGWFG